MVRRCVIIYTARRGAGPGGAAVVSGTNSNNRYGLMPVLAQRQSQ